MSSKISILAGSGLTALAMLSSASAADARAAQKHACTVAQERSHHCARVKYVWVPVSAHHGKRHGQKAMAVAAAPAVASGEVSDLRSKIDSLTARLEAAEAANRAVADQAAAASAQTAALGTQVAANQKAVAGQVKSAINASLPKPNWSAETKITGTLFFSASNINQQNVNNAGIGIKTRPTGTGFDVKRGYIGVEHTFDKHWAASVVLDTAANNTTFGTSGNLGGVGSANGTGVYLKNAYGQYKYNDAFGARVGLVGTTWFGFVEGITGTRYIQETIVDRLNLGSSADYGAQAFGTFGDPKGLNFTYQFNIENGGGFRNPVRTNSVDFEGRIAANYKGFTAAIGGYSGKRAANAQGVTLTNWLTAARNATREDALIAYINPRFRIGGEWYWAKDFSQGIVLGAPEDVTTGWSVFGTVYVIPKWSVFGRYDRVQPNQYTAPNRKEDYYNFGVTYSPAKVFDLSLVYKRDQLNNNSATVTGGIATQNGTIGAAGFARGTYDEIGLFGQVKF